VIARLNIGGPTIQAITLTKRLERLGYTTTLVRGHEGPTKAASTIDKVTTTAQHMRAHLPAFVGVR
jgi:hypothetical protein